MYKRQDVYDATEWVTPSIEIVDSRIKDWKIRLPDTIADNGSSARFMLGGRMMPIGAVDMRLTGMTLEQNGVLVSSGTTAEVWGDVYKRQPSPYWMAQSTIQSAFIPWDTGQIPFRIRRWRRNSCAVPARYWVRSRRVCYAGPSGS